MHPQMATPTREQVVEQLNKMIAARVTNLTCFEKQRRAKKIRYDMAVMDLQVVPLTQWEGVQVSHGPRVVSSPNPARARAELDFQASQLEYEAAVVQLDGMIEQIKEELQQLNAQLKQAGSSLIDPRSVGVMM
jgi:uncharacterized coiled-coil protein SlyX